MTEDKLELQINKTEQQSRSSSFSATTNKNEQSDSSRSTLIKELFTSEHSKQLIDDIDKKLTLLVNLIKSKNYSDSRRKYYSKKIVNRIIDSKCEDDNTDSINFGRLPLPTSTPYNVNKSYLEVIQPADNGCDLSLKINDDKSLHKQDSTLESQTSKHKSVVKSRITDASSIEKAQSNIINSTIDTNEGTLSNRYKELTKTIDEELNVNKSDLLDAVSPRRLFELYKLEFNKSCSDTNVTSSTKSSSKSLTALKNKPSITSADWKYYKTTSEINLDIISNQVQNTNSENQITNSKTGSEDHVIKYAERERARQLSWINNEINCLSKLKKILEKNQTNSTILNTLRISSGSTISSPVETPKTLVKNCRSQTYKTLSDMNTCLSELKKMLKDKQFKILDSATRNSTSTQESTSITPLENDDSTNTKSNVSNIKVDEKYIKNSSDDSTTSYLKINKVPQIAVNGNKKIVNEQTNALLVGNVEPSNFEVKSRMGNTSSSYRSSEFANKESDSLIDNEKCDEEISRLFTKNKNRKSSDFEFQYFQQNTNSSRNSSNVTNKENESTNDNSCYNDQRNYQKSRLFIENVKNIRKRDFEFNFLHRNSLSSYSSIDTKKENDKKVIEDMALKTIYPVNELRLKDSKTISSNSTKLENSGKSNPVAYFLTFEEVSNGEFYSFRKTKSHLENVTVKIPRKRESNKTNKKSSAGEEKYGDLGLQEYLFKNRSDFIKAAEWRRQCLTEIIYMRDKRNADFSKRGLFTTQQMKAITTKQYKKSQEVQEKLRMKENLQQKNLNRQLANIFSKKLQQKTLQGQVTLSTSKAIIFS